MQSNLNWDIIERPIFSNNTPLTNHKAIFRNDTNTLLNVAKTTYTPTNNQRFLEIVDKMQQITNFPIKCFDEFEGGKKVLAFLECTEPMKVLGYDFKDYMLIGNSHDSSTGFFIGNSSIMARCSNRFSKVFRQLQVHHTKNHDLKIDSLLKSFEIYNHERRALFNQMELMQKVYIDDAIKLALVERLVNMTLEEKLGQVELSTRKINLISNINSCIDREYIDLGQNAFGLLQGITNYTTHVRNNSQKVFGNVLGGAARMNQEAFSYCEALI
ncbi:DUF932 domain-containing protein [Emticicia sp.]|uniref:DUF932 domain-containing protein n=1 Tax=Emticicia sp. TaxID=1930953 RepID=UPI0037513569